VAQTYAYDALGRTTNVVNVLGSFGYSYDGATTRLLDVNYPNGQTSHYDYFDNLGDDRLQRITHRKPDTSLISRFTHAYNPFGNITNWVQEMSALTETWTIGYDAADQLLSVSANQGGTNTIAFNYSYDATGNRLFEEIKSIRRSFQYNSLNELVSSSQTNNNDVVYEWDAEQRLVAINRGTNRSEFSYDGSERRVKIVEKAGGLAQNERRFVWCGMAICEERNAADVVVNHYFAMGEQQSGVNEYYTKDHLGSIRELSDASVALRSRYGYQAYGNSTKLLGDLDANFTFTGHFIHSPLGLFLAPYRGYDPANARWLSRDPVGESSGLNLYAYVGNSPIVRTDPLAVC